MNEIITMDFSDQNYFAEEENEHDLRIQEHMGSLPPRFRNLYALAAKNQASPRQAIKAKCHDCVGYEDASQRIRDCRSFRCPLWAYRPYQSADCTFEPQE